MKNLRNKPKISTIALILVLTISAILVALPAATAQDVNKLVTYPFIGAVPNPVGVGQEVLLHIGISLAIGRVDDAWEGLTVTVERPDGTIETLGPLRTDSTGGTGYVYVPDQVGTYYLQTHFPTQTGFISSFGVGPNYTAEVLASDSEKLELIVQPEPVEIHPGFPLPTDYWTRPIDAQLREWSSISGSWLIPTMPASRSRPQFHPYNDGPETAHILWAKPIGGSIGGLVGGERGPHAFECGDGYEGKFSGSLIIAGILYYNKFDSYEPKQETVAVDLHTGEELWCKTFLDNERIDFGQLFYWDSYNCHSVFAYLWIMDGSTWCAFDARTGEWMYNMTDVPPGTPVYGTPTIYGPKGEIYIYTVNLEEGWMTLWNSSRVGSDRGSWGRYVHGRTFNATGGYEWNVTIPEGLSGSVQKAYFEDKIFGATCVGVRGHMGGPRLGDPPIEFWAISLKPGQEGQLLFKETWQPPPGNLSISLSTLSLEDGIFTLWSKELRQFYGFSLDTGKQLWGPTASQPYQDLYVATTRINAYGRLFVAGMAGVVHCYNVTTGDLLWTYEANDLYTEILYGNNWWARILFVTDGKIYLGHDEHSPIDPKARGAPFYCLDAETGDEIWRIDGMFRQTRYGGHAMIGDNIIAAQDTYDQRIYAIGKGPSATTVTASPKVTVKGSSVVIEGSVTDISAGTLDYDLAARFPNGVPAVSDDDMSDWMLHVYKQFPRPADATGVTVKITGYDPNGNYQDYGTTTTDPYGNYGLAINPEVEGTYWIMATFEGSESYWGSSSTSYFGVDLKLSPSTQIEPDVEPTAEAPLISTEFAILAAVAITVVIGAASFYVLRRRK